MTRPSLTLPQILLPASNLLQLGDVRDACCDFLQSHLHPTNCLGTPLARRLGSALRGLAGWSCFAVSSYVIMAAKDWLVMLHVLILG